MTAIEFQYKLINLQEGLMRYAYHLTADKDNAKDLVQDTFLKALKYCDKFIYESNFKSWAYTIMKNTFINNYHRAVRQNKKDGFYGSYSHTSEPDEPASVYSSGEIVRMMEALNDNDRLPLKMHYEGFRYKEIAETLDLNLGTVKSRIFCARKKLMEQLNG